MKLHNKFEFESLVGHKIIIFGEVNRKKTYYTAKFVQFLIEDQGIEPGDISILDFGPELIKIKGKKIGGRIDDIYKQSLSCNNIRPEWKIIPARLTAKSKEDLHKIAEHNYMATSRALEKYLKNPTPYLIINDISIYLQGGAETLLLDAITKSETFFGNTYYGTSIETKFDPIFSDNERKAVERLLKKIEISFETS